MAAAGACSNDDDGDGTAAGDASAPVEPRYLPFRGRYQTGITAPVPESGVLAAVDVVRAERADLVRTLRELTDEIEGLMSGRPYGPRDARLAPVHTGSLGDRPPATDLSVVVSVGASLFDDRFGLGDRRPQELVQMTQLANDRLDPARTHGDLLLAISADSPDASIFALRQVLRRTRDHLVLRWMVEGFNRRSRPAPGQAPVRNLMGFKDGTANLDPGDPAAMARFVWVGDGDDEPAWTVGGSYQAVRLIRMLVEFWDRTPLVEQEAIIGRHKDTGAPLGGRRETEIPSYEDDPDGEVTPLDAHIRLANPRTPETADSLILRRGLSFSRGFDGAGRLDQGLAFVSYQRSLERGFLAVQDRLAGEPLEEYVRPEGGGFYFALPGVDADGDWLGSGLFR